MNKKMDMNYSKFVEMIADFGNKMADYMKNPKVDNGWNKVYSKICDIAVQLDYSNVIEM